jgi:glycosyltransferase involved in cell wall biosynthesis
MVMDFMKILLATYWAVPHVGGVWNYMVQLKKDLEKLGHEVDLLGFGEDNNYVHLVNKGVKLENDELMPLLQAKLTSENYPEIYANALVKYTEFQRYVYELAAVYFGLDHYDVIHTQDVISTASLSRVKPAGVPLVATLHGSVAHEIRVQLKTIYKSPNSYMAKEYFDMLERQGATSGNLTIVANNWLKNILTQEFQVPENQIKVLHYGYDIEGFIKKMRVNSPIKKPENKKVITFTGRLVELKGVQHLLAALHKLKKVRNDWVCWIIGNGDKLSELRTQSKILGIDDDVFFFGKRDDIPYLLTISDIYVLPSLLENQPLSVIEAQLAGKPVIVSDAGGLPEIVENGVTGIVSPAGDEEALFENIELLLDSEKLRNKLGKNAKNWGWTHWSQDKAVKNLLNAYRNAMTKVSKNKDDE